jgi:chaperonin cofactor prefoldin
MQHNVLGEWLHANLCAIYEKQGGSCESRIGPLQDHEAFIPVNLYWPEGQPNMMERLEDIQTALSLGEPDNHTKNNATDALRGSMISDLEAIKTNVDAVAGNVMVVEVKVDAVSKEVQGKVSVVESKVDALSREVQGKVDALSRDLQDKVDSMQKKLDDIEGKVDSVYDEIQTLNGMLSHLIGKLGKD